LKRKVKSCGFQIVSISGVVNKDELNPFENFTRLKSVLQNSCGKHNAKYPYQEHKVSTDSGEGDYAERLKKRRCILFIRRFEYFLRSYYGFVIESENRSYRNYIHFSGIAVIRIYHTVRFLKQYLAE